MGSSSFSRDDYAARSTVRSADAKARGISPSAATFAYDHDVKTGKAHGVHPSLKPTGMRESRDSDAHPVSVPIGIMLDTTGSMAEVPAMIQAALPRLMGCFLDDKASGKRYLGDGYPAILISAVDDFRAMDGEGTFQAGQFESGLEIDDNLTNLWLTRNGGGGEPQESYEIGLYFFANNTVHDHMEKRGRKGYLFIIGDEKAYPQARKDQLQAILGSNPQADQTIQEVVAAAKEKYHVFFVLPKMTSHYADHRISIFWTELLGENVLKLEDPSKICELIVSAVAICEEGIGVADLASDLGVDFSTALVPLSAGQVSKVSAANLPAMAFTGGGIERL